MLPLPGARPVVLSRGVFPDRGDFAIPVSDDDDFVSRARIRQFFGGVAESRPVLDPQRAPFPEISVQDSA